MARYGDVRPLRDAASIRVRGTGENGFDIAITCTEQGLLVELGAWARTLSDIESAWNLIALAVTGRCRLRIEHGRTGVKRWIELLMPDGSWHTLAEPGIEPDRLNPNVRYRMNDVVRSRVPQPVELAAAATYPPDLPAARRAPSARLAWS